MQLQLEERRDNTLPESVTQDFNELNFYLNELKDVKDRLYSSMMQRTTKLDESIHQHQAHHSHQASSITEVMHSIVLTMKQEVEQLNLINQKVEEQH